MWRIAVLQTYSGDDLVRACVTGSSCQYEHLPLYGICTSRFLFYHPQSLLISYYFSIHPQTLWTIYWALQALWQYWYIIITLLYICITILPSSSNSWAGTALSSINRATLWPDKDATLLPLLYGVSMYRKKKKHTTAIITAYIFILFPFPLKGKNISFSVKRGSEAHFLIEAFVFWLIKTMEWLRFTQFTQHDVTVFATVGRALKTSWRLGRGRWQEPGRIVADIWCVLRLDGAIS